MRALRHRYGRAGVSVSPDATYLLRRIAGMIGGYLHEHHMRPDEVVVAKDLARKGFLERRMVVDRWEYSVTPSGLQALRRSQY